jgi:hypothetical protein
MLFPSSMHDALSLCRPHPSTSDTRSPLLQSHSAATVAGTSGFSAASVVPSDDVPVADWLAGIKMERYAGHLEQAGIRSAADAARLQRQDLVALGITLAGHQKRILNGAAALRIPSSTSAAFTLPPPPSGASFV